MLSNATIAAMLPNAIVVQLWWRIHLGRAQSWGGNRNMPIWNRLWSMHGLGKKAGTSKTINHGTHGIHGK